MTKRPFPIVKAIAIAGAVLAEIYMVYTVLAPNPAGPAPLGYLLKRVFVGAIFFGPFGLAVGTGVGLLVQAIMPQRNPVEVKKKESDPASIAP